MFDEKIQKGKWVIGVSGGPDSMALLDMVVQENIQVIVAHVNYHKRETADRDENCVRRYCEQHHLPFYVLSPHYEKGNFQGWAREVRYEFFFGLVHQENGDGVLIAHHKEDSIETYLLQKARKMDVDVFGLQQERRIDGILIVRPLLNYTKSQLIEYCLNNKVEFHHDESNFSDIYRRNKIRHDKIDSMTEKEMNELRDEIKSMNQHKVKKRKEFEKQINDGKISLTGYRQMNEQDRIDFLRFYLSKYAYRKKGYSGLQLKEWDRQLFKRNGNVEISIEQFVLVKDYDSIYVEEKKEVSYRVVLDKIELMETPFFKVSDTGKSTESVTVGAEDFPLIIRPYQQEDKICLRFGTKKINRWFIDRKIPLKERKSWPIVENCKGKIILVPKIGCDIEHYSEKPSFFVIKSMIE